ncbi:unnamed protein product [Rotaria magnacalcarata]|uniref:NHL repeat containing protein n=1 Tax=Rotaria magnacalcarata TaxID=392030 RepID=A0A815Z557_9BILA|nr:unnamed protein product [Rotaria magnacalcarata]
MRHGGCAQNITICPTAVWNSTVRIIAGATSLTGTAVNRLNNPTDVAYDMNGTLYVADNTNDRIQRFVNGSSSGVTVPSFTLNNPTAIFVTSNGILYAVDSLNYRIQMWNNGVVTTVAGGHGVGSTLDKMSTSNGIFVDANLNIYISDTGNNRVTIWAAGNNTIGRLVAGGNGAGTGATNGSTFCGQTGVAGSWSYQFSSPTAILFDQAQNMYVMDSGNNRIQRWSPGSTYGITLVTAAMSSPRGMSFDNMGNLVVADMSYHRIDSFAILCRKFN